MKTFSYTITDPIGIHARPAGLLVKQAQGYESSIKASCGEKEADLKKLFCVMGLGAKQGDTLVVTLEGSDEEIAFAEMQAFFTENSY